VSDAFWQTLILQIGFLLLLNTIILTPHVCQVFVAVFLLAWILRIIASPIEYGLIPLSRFMNKHPICTTFIGLTLLAVIFLALCVLTGGMPTGILGFAQPVMAPIAHGLAAFYAAAPSFFPLMGHICMCLAGGCIILMGLAMIVGSIREYKVDAAIFMVVGLMMPSLLLLSIACLFAGLPLVALNTAAIGIVTAQTLLGLGWKDFMFYKHKGLVTDPEIDGESTSISADWFKTPKDAAVIQSKDQGFYYALCAFFHDHDSAFANVGASGGREADAHEGPHISP
jgi:hypothetical protein